MTHHVVRESYQNLVVKTSLYDEYYKIN